MLCVTALKTKKKKKKASSLGFHLALDTLCNVLPKNAMHCGKMVHKRVGSNACFEIFFLFFFLVDIGFFLSSSCLTFVCRLCEAQCLLAIENTKNNNIVFSISIQSLTQTQRELTFRFCTPLEFSYGVIQVINLTFKLLLFSAQRKQPPPN